MATEAIAAFLADHDLTVYLVLFDRAAFLLGGRFGAVQSFIDDAYAEAEAKRPRNQYSARWGREPREDTGELYAPSALEDADAALTLGSLRPSAAPKAARKEDLEAMVRQLDEGFSRTLLRLIDEKGMTDVECYKKANISRKLFSKIRSDPHYKPSKTTAVAFALALELSLPETQQLLSRAGFTLSHSYLGDIIVETCIQRGVFNVLDVNEILFSYDQPLLGS